MMCFLRSQFVTSKMERGDVDREVLKLKVSISISK